MKSMRMLSTIMWVLLTAIFLSSCGVPQEQAAVDASQVPTTGEEVSPTATEEVTSTTVAEVASEVPTKLEDVPRISVEELKERIDGGEAIVIGDTRVQRVFDVNHIPGAISITSAQVIEARLDDLPLDQEIVLYCT